MSDTTRSYNENARNYEKRWAAYLRHTHTTFVEQLDVSETDRLLDLSCGTGLLARELLNSGKKFEHLTLNDPAEKMLDIARKRLSSHPDISFANSPAHRIPFEDNSFDRIFSLNAFHNYRYQNTVISEIRRVLKRGGRIYVQDWNRSGLFRPLNMIIRHWVPEHIDTRSPEEAKRMLEAHGLLVEKEETWNYRYWKFFFMQALC